MKARVKTDVRMPGNVIAAIDVLVETLGVPKNAFFTLAACEYAVKLTPMLKNKRKQRDMLKKLDAQFQTILKKALEAV